jgi:muramoyltetrapeptide carboxypeptidase
MGVTTGSTALLRPGSTVAVVAPAGQPQIDGVRAGLDLVRSWGLSVLVGRYLEARHFTTAGTAEQRTEDLVWALTDPGIDAVWLARGGYGSVHTLAGLPDRLDGRVIIGCSDATALFAALHGRGGALVHGPMLESIATRADDESRSRIRRLLLGDATEPLAGYLLCGPDEEVRAPVVGGNLCVAASLAGTPWALRAHGTILALEEVGEAAYRIDRLISQLRWSGGLDGVRAVALGEMVDCPTPKGADFSLEDLFVALLEPLGVPVLAGLRFGHGATNLAWHVGGDGILDRSGLRVLPPGKIPA